MAKAIYVGTGSARKAKALYLGVSGKARAVKKVYVGVSGKARLAWEKYVKVTSITLKGTLIGGIGDKYDTDGRIELTLLPANATNKTITWSCSNTRSFELSGATNTSCIVRARQGFYPGTGVVYAASVDGVVGQIKVANNRHNFTDSDGDSVYENELEFY